MTPKINAAELLEGVTEGSWKVDENHEPYCSIRIVSGQRLIAKLWQDDAPVPEFNAEQYRNAKLMASSKSLAAEVVRLEEENQELRERIDAAKMRCMDAKALHSKTYDMPMYQAEKEAPEVVCKMEQIVYSVTCYLDGIDGSNRKNPSIGDDQKKIERLQKRVEELEGVLNEAAPFIGYGQQVPQIEAKVESALAAKQEDKL